VTRLGRVLAGGGPPFYRDLALLSGGQVLVRLLGFLAFAVLARRLAPEEYGAVEYVVGLALFFSTLVDWGLGPVGVRRAAGDAEALPGLAAQIPAIRLAVALVSVPAMALVALPTAPGSATPGLVWLFAVSLLAAPWRQVWVLQATGRMGQTALAQTVRAAVFALVVVTLAGGPAALVAVGWAEVAAAVAMSLYCVAVQHGRVTPWRLRPPVRGLGGLFREGAVVGLGSLVWTANQYAPLLLVASLLGGEETAWLAAGVRIAGAFLIFGNLYHFNLYPTMARGAAGADEGFAETLAASFRVAAWGGTLAGLALTVLAEPLCVLVFGRRFEAAAPTLMIVAWGLPIGLLSGHSRWWLAAAGIQSRVVYSQLAGSLALAVLGPPLVLGLGARGAAVAAVVGALAVWGASHALAARVGGRMPPLAIALAPAGLAAALVVAVQLVGRHDWSNGVAVVAFALAAPVLDRALLPALTRLGAVRLGPTAAADAPA